MKTEMKSLLVQYLGRLGRLPKYYTTYWLRPKKSEDVVITEFGANMPKIGIVIQGKIKYKDDFTLETIKLYRKYYPYSLIILSTWDDENPEVLKDIEKCGVMVCTSTYSENLKKGYGPTNYQIQTSLTGVKKALECGCDYILKTRTDQRAYETNIFPFLLKLMGMFPVNIDCPVNGRIVSISLSTFTNRYYNISDMFIFGHGEDVLRYFSCPLDNRDPKTEVKTTDQLEYSKNKCGEIYFTTNYIESLGFELKWTLLDSDFYRKNLFIIIDAESIDLYWPKYSCLEYRWRNYKPFALKTSSFKEWLCLQD